MKIFGKCIEYLKGDFARFRLSNIPKTDKIHTLLCADLPA
jgi:hypothetical protein